MNKIKELQRTQLKEVLSELRIKNEDATEFAIGFILDEINYYNINFQSRKEDVLRHLRQIEITVDASDKDIASMELITDILFSSEIEREKKYVEYLVLND